MCVTIISHLGFLAATWVLDLFLLHLFMQNLFITDICTSWARPLSAHGRGTIKPISCISVNLDSYPLQFHLDVASLDGFILRVDYYFLSCCFFFWEKFLLVCFNMLYVVMFLFFWVKSYLVMLKLLCCC